MVDVILSYWCRTQSSSSLVQPDYTRLVTLGHIQLIISWGNQEVGSAISPACNQVAGLIHTVMCILHPLTGTEWTTPGCKEWEGGVHAVSTGQL